VGPDTCLFRPGDGFRPWGNALTFSHSADDEAKAYADKAGVRLTIQEPSLQHKEIPALLRRFEYYIDVKRGVKGQILEGLGLTGQEALASGCRVIRWDGKVLQGLPEENRPESVAKRYFQLYEELLKR